MKFLKRDLLSQSNSQSIVCLVDNFSLLSMWAISFRINYNCNPISTYMFKLHVSCFTHDEISFSLYFPFNVSPKRNIKLIKPFTLLTWCFFPYVHFCELCLSCVYCCRLLCNCCSLCACGTLCVFVVPYVYLLHYVCIAAPTLDAGLLARSQHPEGPATGHLDTGFFWFPCVYKRMLRWFPSFQVATTCL